MFNSHCQMPTANKMSAGTSGKIKISPRMCMTQYGCAKIAMLTIAGTLSIGLLAHFSDHIVLRKLTNFGFIIVTIDMLPGERPAELI